MNFITILSVFSIIYTSGSNKGNYSGSSVLLGLCGLSFCYLLNYSCLLFNSYKWFKNINYELSTLIEGENI